MDKTVATVLKGFTELNEKRRKEFIVEINKYIEGTLSLESINESFTKSASIANTINFGPAPTGCPCCGN
jgi:hypothetical protein